ncbi:hypothetical protein GQ44DRAFT_631370 [Phaeosphaeriaceae sp. PMI808]|nr:hypothetical protein GQ44DRAFT_631370 [Phaeosphaeriaceae sp. PMI808]
MDPISALVSHSQYYWKRLQESTVCCEPDTKPTGPVQIADVPATTQPPNCLVPLRTQECADLEVLDDYLGNSINAEYNFRLISISQKNSWSKLQITKSMLQKIIEHHDVDASFLEVPLSFYYRKTDEEQSFCVPWTIKEDENATQMFYTFRYAEYKGHPNEPWVIRQVGVYHKYDVKKKTSLYILVNAVPDSVAYQRVLESLTSYQTTMRVNPLWLHGVIHASYFMRWREYIAEYEKRLLPIADTTTATMINKPLRRQVTSQLENSKRYAKNFMRTAQFLQQRSNNTATLLADTLAFRNQGVAQEQNGSMIILTRSAVFITVITLIYLPWTLITGIFGMQFFVMDAKTQRLLTSPQIWIYFVTAVGTTVLTMALYYFMAGFPQVHKKQDGDEAEVDYIPRNLQRGNTDVEKNLQVIGRQDTEWTVAVVKD